MGGGGGGQKNTVEGRGGGGARGCKIKQVQARVEEGSNFWSFYDNVKIKCS